MNTNLTEKLREFEVLDSQRTPGKWEAGVHPGNHRLNIVKPVCFGKYVGKLPDCEGGHVYFLHKPNADYIAAAPSILDLARKQHELLVMAERALNDAHLFAYAHGRRINSVEEVYAALHAAGIGE